MMLLLPINCIPVFPHLSSYIFSQLVWGQFSDLTCREFPSSPLSIMPLPCPGTFLLTVLGFFLILEQQRRTWKTKKAMIFCLQFQIQKVGIAYRKDVYMRLAEIGLESICSTSIDFLPLKSESKGHSHSTSCFQHWPAS